MNKASPNLIEELSPHQVAELLNARHILLVDVREPNVAAANVPHWRRRPDS
jgi:hypothetical protein